MDENKQTHYRDLANILSRDTKGWSKRFNQHPRFNEVVNMGPEVIPELIWDSTEPTQHPKVWCWVALYTICVRNSIIPPKLSENGSREPVNFEQYCEKVVQWGIENGYYEIKLPEEIDMFEETLIVA